MKNKTRHYFIFFAFLQLLVTLTIGAAVSYALESDKAPKGLVIWGKNLTGLTYHQAVEELENLIPKAVVFDNITYKLDTSKSRAKLRELIRLAYVKDGENSFSRVWNFLAGKSVMTLDNPLDEEEITRQLEQFKSAIDREPKPASIKYSQGRFVITDEVRGQSLDIELSRQRIREGVNTQVVPLAVNLTEASPLKTDLTEIKDVLGDYTTYFNPSDSARTQNVRLAAQSLDGVIIPPNGEFSFNSVVGERTTTAGYLPAFIFSDQRMILGEGGGVCQNSSTLFQAVRQANLLILERNSHSLPVYYVPKGEDATVFYGQLDFRFRNDTKGYVYVAAKIGPNWLRVKIFGKADEKHKVLNAPDGYPSRPEDFDREPK